jgi:hypothetical protein
MALRTGLGPSLRHLQIDQWVGEDADGADVVRTLSEVKGLESLRLCNGPASGQTGAALALWLSTNRTVTNLTISLVDHSVSTSSLTAVATAIRGNPHSALINVGLGNCDGGDMDAIALVSLIECTHIDALILNLSADAAAVRVTATQPPIPPPDRVCLSSRICVCICVCRFVQFCVPLLEKRRAPLWLKLNCPTLSSFVQSALREVRRRNRFVSVHFERDDGYEDWAWQPRRLHNAAWSAAALAIACLRAHPTVLARSVLPLIPSVIALSDRACDAARGLEKKASALMELPFARSHCARAAAPLSSAPPMAAAAAPPAAEAKAHGGEAAAAAAASAAAATNDAVAPAAPAAAPADGAGDVALGPVSRPSAQKKRRR